MFQLEFLSILLSTDFLSNFLKPIFSGKSSVFQQFDPDQARYFFHPVLAGSKMLAKNKAGVFVTTSGERVQRMAYLMLCRTYDLDVSFNNTLRMWTDFTI